MIYLAGKARSPTSRCTHTTQFSRIIFWISETHHAFEQPRESKPHGCVPCLFSALSRQPFPRLLGTTLCYKLCDRQTTAAPLCLCRGSRLLDQPNRGVAEARGAGRRRGPTHRPRPGPGGGRYGKDRGTYTTRLSNEQKKKKRGVLFLLEGTPVCLWVGGEL